MKVFVSVLLLFCWSLRLQAAGGGEEGGEGEGGSEKAITPCAISHEKLYTIFPELLENLTVYVNCLSFDRIGELEHGVLSGLKETGGPGQNETGQRLFLSCVSGVIVAMSSPLPPLALKMNSTSCLECNDASVEEEICGTPCKSPCERCYGSPTDCSRCIACVDPEVEHCYVSEEDEGVLEPASCSATCEESEAAKENTGEAVTSIVPREDRFNFCDCPAGYHRELLEYPLAREEEGGELPERCELHPELEEYRCVSSCAAGREVNEELQICFACGLEYCVMCSGNVTAGTAQCEECLRETVFYDHECFACPKALIVLNALEQEEELDVELEDQRVRQIELAVSLPILTILVALVFVLIAVFAHLRYPHVNPQGHKRHRTKPEELDNLPNEDDLRDLEPPLSPADVWRARPTIKLR